MYSASFATSPEIDFMHSIPPSIASFASNLLIASKGSSTESQKLATFLATPSASSTVFSLTNTASAALQALGLFSPDQGAATYASLVIPGVSINLTAIQDGQTFNGLNGNIITVSKPYGVSQNTLIVTSIGGKTLTFTVGSSSATISGEWAGSIT